MKKQKLDKSAIFAFDIYTLFAGWVDKKGKCHLSKNVGHQINVKSIKSEAFTGRCVSCDYFDFNPPCAKSSRCDKHNIDIKGSDFCSFFDCSGKRFK